MGSSPASHSIPILNTLSNTIIPVKLQENNFLVWKSLVRPVLDEYEVLGFVDGSYRTPNQFLNDESPGSQTVNPDYVEWQDEDQRLLLWLHSTISESVLSSYVVAGLPTSRSLWNYLEEQFGADASRTTPACQVCIKFGLYLAVPVVLILMLFISFIIPDPKIPNYTVTSISIKGINLTSDDLIVSPEINISINATNPKGAPGSYYSEKGFSVSIYYYSDTLLCSSDNLVPIFHQQPAENVTTIETVLTGSRVKLTPIIRDSLLDRQSKGMTPLVIYMWISYGVKNEDHPFVSMSAYKIRCKVTVDKLAVDAQIVSNVCRTVKKSTRTSALYDQGIQVLS
ncbi:NDR1/HIN1-like protein 13 [Papaver somniferum]|uniref:NDR1/HIN1-like protein 13 n=1 Tax=Papaver somniferum TaxID=3469 RepID=UPI000E704AD8|nr:NDR1/HIN1-like protein 13 [Papaver somniferum]